MRSSEASLSLGTQPDKSIPGSQISFSENIYTPTHNGVGVKCKAAELSPDAIASCVLEVHLVGDPGNQFYKIPLEPGRDKGRYFDAVRDTGTSAEILANLSLITLFPE